MITFRRRPLFTLLLKENGKKVCCTTDQRSSQRTVFFFFTTRKDNESPANHSIKSHNPRAQQLTITFLAPCPQRHFFHTAKLCLHFFAFIRLIRGQHGKKVRHALPEEARASDEKSGRRYSIRTPSQTTRPTLVASCCFGGLAIRLAICTLPFALTTLFPARDHTMSSSNSDEDRMCLEGSSSSVSRQSRYTESCQD